MLGEVARVTFPTAELARDMPAVPPTEAAISRSAVQIASRFIASQCTTPRVRLSLGRVGGAGLEPATYGV